MKSFARSLLAVLLLSTSLAAASSFFDEFDDDRTIFERRSLGAGLDKRTMTWGDLNYTRDYSVEYSASHWESVAKTEGYADATTAFCTTIHDAAVSYEGPLGYHHVIDCVPTQTGPVVKVFCGGRKKRADGTWSSHTAVRDDTRAVLSSYTSELKAWVKAKPIGEVKCKAYLKKNPRSGVVC